MVLKISLHFKYYMPCYPSYITLDLISDLYSMQSPSFMIGITLVFMLLIVLISFHTSIGTSSGFTACSESVAFDRSQDRVSYVGGK